MIKQLTSNTSYFIVCEATCFGPYVRNYAFHSTSLQRCIPNNRHISKTVAFKITYATGVYFHEENEAEIFKV